MNKKYIMILGLLLITTVSAIIVTNNGYILDRSEMAEVSNQEISNYMINTLALADYKIIEDRIIIYYNITYLESESYFNNETGQTETRYRVFTQYKPFIINKELWNDCIDITTKQNCVNVLVNNDEPYTYQITENNITTNITIKSTYLQAYEEQERQYHRAKDIRDNAINNDLDELFDMIQ